MLTRFKPDVLVAVLELELVDDSDEVDVAGSTLNHIRHTGAQS